MTQTIIDFDLDDESHWRAVLACGHCQHVRHDPPLIRREWVLTDAGRKGKLGAELECKKCDDGIPPDVPVDGQETACEPINNL